MKVYDRDLRKIKVEVDLNNEIRFRGMTKPPAKIKVKAKKFDNDTVSVELVDLPKHIEFKRMREKKKVSGKNTPEIKPAKEVKKDIEKAVEETKSKTKDKKKDTKKEITEKTKK